MHRRSIARVIAIVLTGAVLGLAVAKSEAQDVARYRTLSHDALLATVIKSWSSSLGMNVFVFIIMTGVVVFFIEGVTSVLLWVFDEIMPERAPSIVPERDGPPG